MGLFVAGAVSTGGVAALAVKVSRKKNEAREIIRSRRNEDDNEHD